jgi:hypothetical protein
MLMDEMLELLTEQAGGLLRVIYSMTLNEPRQLQAVGLIFQRLSVTFEESTKGILCQRHRLCGAGLCRETEDCYLADVIPQWRALLGTKVAQAVAYPDGNGRIDRIRLEFDGEKTHIVELCLEDGVLRVVHL